ncbi:MAG: NAD(P)/FAD-dependent oxidoreductase [Actinomycetota bacterium]
MVNVQEHQASEPTRLDPIEADYVVVGAGAMGMAFVDEILSHGDGTVAMIDRHAKPGGHWNDAYAHVRLHQPSFFYGVSSTRLGTDRVDEVGLNAGLSELASGAEVCAYFDQVMQRRFLPSGRVTHLPSADYADGVVTIAPSGATVEVRARRAVVDATYMKVTVPSTRPPAYEIDAGATVIPPNDLPKVAGRVAGYTIVGAGKTAFDAILWLLANHVEPSAIRWIAPRDSWLINREFTQPGERFRIGEQVELIAAADSADDLFAAMESSGQFLRIDPSVEPTMYRCATVTEAELVELRRVHDVVRGQRVGRIGVDVIELDDGSTLPTTSNTVHVDCSADGLERRPVAPVFTDGRITLQTLRTCQQVFSAGLIGRIETLPDASLDEKNELATVIPHPDTPHDFLTTSLAHFHNMGRWGMHPVIGEWLLESRLSPGGPRAVGDFATAIEAVGKLESFLQPAP